MDRQGGPFVPVGGLAPALRFSLFDNPSGVPGLRSGTRLSFADTAGTVGPNRFTFDWTKVVVGLSAAGNTIGNVILQVDLLSGGYAAMDNFIVAASNTAGDVPRIGEPPRIGVVPEPSTYALIAAGLLGVGMFARRRRHNQTS